MLSKSFSLVKAIGCCGCFGFTRRPQRLPKPISRNYHYSHEFLLDENVEDEDEDVDVDDDDNCSYNSEITDTNHGDDSELQRTGKCPQEILKFRSDNGLICRQFPVKETNKLIRGEDPNGKKMVNEYVHERKIGSGSYGKVVLYRSSIDGKHYAIKSFHKSHLLKQRVAPSETAMTDVFREGLDLEVLSEKLGRSETKENSTTDVRRRKSYDERPKMEDRRSHRDVAAAVLNLFDRKGKSFLHHKTMFLYLKKTHLCLFRPDCYRSDIFRGSTTLYA